MSGATLNSHREGPARARALARQRATKGPESATAWLEGSHLAIVLHPEWQQVRGSSYEEEEVRGYFARWLHGFAVRYIAATPKVQQNKKLKYPHS